MPKPRELELTTSLARKHRIPGSRIAAVRGLAGYVADNTRKQTRVVFAGAGKQARFRVVVLASKPTAAEAQVVEEAKAKASRLPFDCVVAFSRSSQAANIKNPDQYERFLTGCMSARRLCSETGFADMANQLVGVLWGLQNAHDRLVYREANDLLFRIVKGLREGKISRGRARSLFGLSSDALKELTANLESVRYAGVGVKKETLPYDVAEHLRTPEERAAYLEACRKEAKGDPALIAQARRDIARASAVAQTLKRK